MEPMQDFHDYTLSILEKERQGYEELLELACAQRKQLLAGKVGALDAIVDRQSEVMRRVSNLDRQADSCLRHLQMALHLDSDPVTLAAIAAVSPEPYCARYRELRSRLSALSDEIRRTSLGNLELARNALAYIDFSLRLIGAPQDATIYAADATLRSGDTSLRSTSGAPTPGAPRGLVDQRA
jgi:hypothetical protein